MPKPEDTNDQHIDPDIDPANVLTIPLEQLAAKGLELSARQIPNHGSMGPEAEAEARSGAAMLSIVQTRATLNAIEVNRQLVKDNKKLVWATWSLAGTTIVLAVVTIIAAFIQ